MRPLALVGNLSRDRVDGAPPRIGGAPFYASAALRLLGRRAHVVAKCADADRRAFLRALTALGAQATLLHGETTAAFSFEYRGDTRVMSVDAVGDAWRPEEVARIPAGAWVHVAPLLRTDFPAETLAALAHGRRVVLDGQGLVRVARVGALELDATFDRELLEHVSVLKLAEEEARLVGPVDALGVPEVVVTLASRGCVVHAAGGVTQIAARPLRGDVDPTGAGDAFLAAYTATRSDGQPPASAARRATAVVSALLARRLR